MTLAKEQTTSSLEAHKLPNLSALEAFANSIYDELIFRSIQGSQETLSSLTDRVCSIKTEILSGVRNPIDVGESNSAIVTAALERESSLALQERIKVIANRKCYGLDKKCNIFEDEDQNSARVWELNDAQINSVFDK